MNKIALGIRRDTKKFFLTLLVSIPTVWGVTKPFIDMTGFDPKRKLFIILIFVTFLVIALVRTHPKKRVGLKLKNTNTKIVLEFGDIWNEDNNIVVSANEYFDSDTEKCVSPRSLHGQFIEEVLGGKKAIFDEEIDNSLKGVGFNVVEREYGKNKKYDIGTVGLVAFSKKKYLVLALANTNGKYEAYTTPSSFLIALAGLWEKARTECNGYPLSLPLLGTGLGRLGLPEMSVIELILISILRATKEKEIAAEIRIILHEANFENIDLRRIALAWN